LAVLEQERLKKWRHRQRHLLVMRVPVGLEVPERLLERDRCVRPHFAAYDTVRFAG
jgi:hypothetical protein